jgi:hypothetical protein
MSESKFREAYEVALRAACTEHPDEYLYKPDAVPEVVGFMMCAIHENKFNHAGRALRATCKALGIKYTQKSIRAFVNGETSPTPVTPPPVPLIQLEHVTAGPLIHTTLVVAQDATREELDSVMSARGVDPAGYWMRSSNPIKQSAWLKEQRLSLLPGKRRIE